MLVVKSVDIAEMALFIFCVELLAFLKGTVLPFLSSKYVIVKVITCKIRHFMSLYIYHSPS